MLIIYANFIVFYFGSTFATNIQTIAESFAEFDFDKNDVFNNNLCIKSGIRYVKNYIQYQCISIENNSANKNYVGKAIGCVPTNLNDGDMILPGSTYTAQHFRYKCERDEKNLITLKITHCVDSAGELVNIGNFYSESLGTIHNNFTTANIECVGDEFSAKKIVHKWAKCRLNNGETLTEGNFAIMPIESESLRTSLQSYEIISCVRDVERVLLKCTGCVTSAGEHVAITNYINVEGQWTQCRRFKDGCRLINISSDYIDCDYGGKKILNGITFQSDSGLSSFYCQNGAIIKKGCLLNGNLILVGEVRYVDDRPLFCSQRDQLISFNELIGCDLDNGAFKRFSEVWRVGNVMKRCSWQSNRDGITKSQVISFACMDENELIPLHKIIQRKDGEYFKCALEKNQLQTNTKTTTLLSTLFKTTEGATKNTAVRSDEKFIDDDEADVVLSMQPVSPEELENFLKKKRSRVDVVEYFGIGAKSENEPKLYFQVPQSDLNKNEHLTAQTSQCTDSLPFCNQLIGYCNSAQNNAILESGLAIDLNSSEFHDVQPQLQTLLGSQLNETYFDAFTEPAGCSEQLSWFQKFQILVEIICPKTCKKCFIEKHKERLISNLEKTSHCG